MSYSENSIITNNNRIQAVIFDLDGTLIDSEPNYYLSDSKLLEEYGIKNVNREFKNRYVGLSSKDMMKDIKEKYKVQDSLETMIAKKDQYYFEIAKDNTHVFLEMKSLLDILKFNNHKLAIASGSTKNIISKILKITNLESYFDVIVSAEEVEKGKPSPDIYFEVASRLNVEPRKCLVLEDSAPGVDAAKAAHMFCVAIPDVRTTSITDSYYNADLLFEGGIDSFIAKNVFNWMQLCR